MSLVQLEASHAMRRHALKTTSSRQPPPQKWCTLLCSSNRTPSPQLIYSPPESDVRGRTLSILPTHTHREREREVRNELCTYVHNASSMTPSLSFSSKTFECDGMGTRTQQRGHPFSAGTVNRRQRSCPRIYKKYARRLLLVRGNGAADGNHE